MFLLRTAYCNTSPMRLLSPLTALMALFALQTPAAGGETPWQDIAPQASARLVSSDVLKDGRTMLALELSMPETTWTYWRVPGETGIPLQLEFEGSKGVSAFEVKWPFPVREVIYGFVDHIYRGDIVLPVELSVQGERPFVAMQAVLGVCSDICVPVFANFELELNLERRDRSQSLRINQAMARVPIPWDQQTDIVEAVAFDQPNQRVLVRLSSPDVDFSSMILSTQNPSIVFGPPQKSQIEGVVSFPKLGESGDDELYELSYIISFMSALGPYEIRQDAVSLADIGG
ncbi:MAG TPA: hypothetical protein ENJ90_08910 [Devosia sp.]|nr:hypothetical protein [Devosia sp.]